MRQNGQPVSEQPHTELRDGLASLRADFREAVASIRGSIDTLAAVKAGEVKDLANQVSDVRHDHKSTKLTVSALHDRLDKYPDPTSLQSTLDQFGSKLDGLASHDDIRQLENDLRSFPKPDAIEAAHATHDKRLDAVEELAQDNRLSLARLSGVGAVGGLVGAGLLELLSLLA